VEEGATYSIGQQERAAADFRASRERAVGLEKCIQTCGLSKMEVFTAVTMKNGVFWDVTPCGSCKNRRFGVT
jgi:hypothetical protein